MGGNGRDAVNAAKYKGYDLIFMDCEMPEMDGFEATRQIRAWEKTQSIKPTPIVALTAHVLQIHKEHALACGMNAHVGKPVEIKHLRDTLTRFLPPLGKPTSAHPSTRQHQDRA